MVYFGPSGIQLSYVLQKVDTMQMASILKDHGLFAYEYAFTYGVNLSEQKAIEIGEVYSKLGITLSVHAPYYINFASSDPMQIEKSISYVISCIEKMNFMKSKRVVFHPGSLTKQTREVAFSNTLNGIKELVNAIKTSGFENVNICPETMGKHGQIGSVEEVYEICKIDDMIIPTLDFGHINSFTGGKLKTKADFIKIFDLFVKDLKKKEIHIHFSKIKYGDKGELTHLTFEDEVFGPDPQLFVEAISEYKDVDFYVICESKDTQFDDALKLKKLYEEIILTK